MPKSNSKNLAEDRLLGVVGPSHHVCPELRVIQTDLGARKTLKYAHCEMFDQSDKQESASAEVWRCVLQ